MMDMSKMSPKMAEREEAIQLLADLLQITPNLRIGQLLVNATYDDPRQITTRDHIRDIFYMEDHDLLYKLELYLKTTGNE